MSILDTRSQATIVGTIAAGIQSRLTSAILNFAKGKVFRAIAEAYAGGGLWLQKEALQIATLTRLATSHGADIDTFLADFPLAGVTRLGAQAATGLCVFARYTAGPTVAYVPVGGQVRTQDGGQIFEVYADTSNPSFDASYGDAGGYAIPAQVANVSAPVRGITNADETLFATSGGVSGGPGSNGNVGAGAIALVASSMPGIDAVTNPAALTNGFDVEGDVSVKARFALAVAGRGGGTEAAIRSAIANIKVGMTCVVLQNQDINGVFTPGAVSVIVDDGSGNLSAELLEAAQTAVFGIYAAGARPGVYAAQSRLIDVVMQITTTPGYVHQNVVAKATAALGLAINGLGQGSGVEYFDLSTVVCNVPGCSGIVPGSYTLNGAATDIAGSPVYTPKANSLVLS